MTVAGHAVFLLLIVYFAAPVKTDCTSTSTNKSGNCTTEAKKISPLFHVEAQSNVSARVGLTFEMEGGCNELPLKVEVQINASSQGNFIFPGGGITQRPDKTGSPYGGVIYKYKNDGSIRIMAPKHTVASGVALFTGGSAWEGVHRVTENLVGVRYRAWCRCNLPPPGFESPWTDINVFSKSFLEISHGLGVTPDMVIVQLRHGSSTSDWVSDVTGSMSSTEKGSRRSGLIYGYDSSKIRIWAPDNGSLFNTTDGWGLPKDHGAVLSGQVKVYAWNYLMNIRSKSVNINKSSSKSNLEVSLPEAVDVYKDIVYFTVSPTDGDNRGFLFPGISSVQNTDPTIQYGGVMYAYSTDKIRLWHPKLDSQHFLVYINNEWGRGNHVQSSESVVAKVSVWKAGQICLIPKNQRTTPKVTTVQSTSTTRTPTATARGTTAATRGTTALTGSFNKQTTSPPARGLGNTSARQKDKKESWYDRSLTVPVIWLLGGGGLLLLILLIACTVCLCQSNSSDKSQTRVSPQEIDQF
ncbi:uncharacterized protein LOC128189615 [Crassostrea angulata]|uniref:uncharacterized protein LOC128189615 n=1 Tax=Magallana angulata TaxID=2784310 RepID=UPI0022B095B6|nr:uncharacterized protein LOC128189615 [Crassostrea angulata]